MTIPPWIALVLDRELPNLTGGERDRIASALIDNIPGNAVSAAIAESTATVLAQRGLADADGSLARECGRNAAQTVLFSLSGWCE